MEKIKTISVLVLIISLAIQAALFIRFTGFSVLYATDPKPEVGIIFFLISLTAAIIFFSSNKKHKSK